MIRISRFDCCVAFKIWSWNSVELRIWDWKWDGWMELMGVLNTRWFPLRFHLGWISFLSLYNYHSLAFGYIHYCVSMEFIDI